MVLYEAQLLKIHKLFCVLFIAFFEKWDKNVKLIIIQEICMLIYVSVVDICISIRMQVLIIAMLNQLYYKHA